MDVVYTKIGKWGGVKSIEGADTLIDGKGLFAQITWNGEDVEWKDEDLSNLIDGEKMFQSNTTLISFDDNLQNLVKGGSMFSGCTKLTIFNSELKNLLSGVNMFAGCKLDDTSLENITTNINDIKDINKENDELWNYTIHNSTRNIDINDRGRIYIGCDETIPEEKLTDYSVRLYKKGWDVLFNGNNYTPVRVWVEFNDYGELIDADLSGLVDGEDMLKYTNVGQLTNEDGTV
jgi:hypothetical protein